MRYSGWPNTPHIDEHDRVEVQLAQDAVRARPRVGPSVVEGEQQRPRRKIDRLPAHEVEERLEVDRLVAGVRISVICVAKSSASMP